VYNLSNSAIFNDLEQFLTEILRTRHCWASSVSYKIGTRDYYRSQSCIVPSPTILIDLQGHFRYFSLKISTPYFSGLCRRSSQGWRCRWHWVTFKGRLRCLYLINKAYIGPHLRNQLQWWDVICEQFLLLYSIRLLYDAARDLLVTAKLLVIISRSS